MYLSTSSMTAVAFATTNGGEFAQIVVRRQGTTAEWVENALWVTWQLILRVAASLGAWLIAVAPSLSNWTVDAFSTASNFLHAHPHPFHIFFWSIFFGPIIILLPCLLMLEVLILIILNLGFVSHGLIPGSIPDQYENLKEAFMESREKLFARVESATSVLNKWTSDHPPLLVLRLASGLMGLYILFYIWSGL